MNEVITFYLEKPIYTNSFDILMDLYSPIIGQKSVFLYTYFENLIKEKRTRMNIDELYKNCNISSKDFLFIRRNLESIGLIKTYTDIKNDYYIVLKGVIDPLNFFKSSLLTNLLLTCIDENQFNKLKEKYLIEDKIKDLNDISAKFEDSFTLKKGKDYKIVVDNSLNVSTNFDINSLKKNITKKSQINSDYISDIELNKITNLATLYGIDEKSMAEIVIDSYDFSNKIGERINFDYLNKRIKAELSYKKVFNKKNDTKIKINSQTELANLINKYENTAPRVYLKEKQNGVEPVGSELNLLYDLQSNIGLNNGVINCLIDYILKEKDGELPKEYVKKIAVTLVRKNITNSLDAYTYLNKKNTFKTVKENDIKTIKEKEVKTTKVDEVLVDDNEEYDNPFGD